MPAIFENGLAIVLVIQGMGDWLVIPMKFFSTLGTEDFFLAALPLIYWCVNASVGLRVGFILMTSDILNFAAKMVFAGPRPYWVSPQVKNLWSETSFGVPSGHAQTAMSIWGTVALASRQAWVRIAAVALIFAIGLSRVYLGAHFPHDVLAGWALGGLLLYLFSRFWEPAAMWFGKKTTLQQVWYAFLASLVFILIGLSALGLRSNFEIPEEWSSHVLLGGTILPNPTDANPIFTTAGSLFGLALGAISIRRMGGYRVSGPLWNRALRYWIGLLGVIILWLGLGSIFPRGDAFVFYALRYMRYTLIAFWVIAGAPWVFMQLKLAERPNSSI